MSQEPPRKVNPPRPPPPTSLEGGATPEEQFEATYREAYNLIDRGITLITEGHNAQVRGVLNQAYFPVSRSNSLVIIWCTLILPRAVIHIPKCCQINLESDFTACCLIMTSNWFILFGQCDPTGKCAAAERTRPHRQGVIHQGRKFWLQCRENTRVRWDAAQDEVHQVSSVASLDKHNLGPIITVFKYSHLKFILSLKLALYLSTASSWYSSW